jgi:hypothetical protein
MNGYAVSTKQPRSNGKGRNQMPVPKGYALGDDLMIPNKECAICDEHEGSPTVQYTGIGD